MPAQYITTPRPPVSLKEARRAATAGAGDWVDVVQAGEYLVPQPGGQPDKVVSTRYSLSRVIAASATGSTAAVALRVTNAETSLSRVLFPELPVPASGFLDLPLQSAVLDAQEVLQIASVSGGTAHVSVSFVAATREQFTVLP
jgi:hypothetical protein